MSYQTITASYPGGSTTGPIDYYYIFDYATNQYNASFISDPSYNALFYTTAIAPVQYSSLYLNTLDGERNRQMLTLPMITIPASGNYYFTYSMWVYHVTGNYAKTIIVFYPSSPPPTNYTQTAFIEPWPGNGFFRLRSLGTSGSSGQINNTNIKMNAWTHYVFTISNLSTKIYLNGVNVGTFTFGTASGSWYPTTLASWDTGAYFSGFLSEIRTYNRLLTDTEVSRLYRYTEPAPTTVTVTNQTTYYRFNVEDISSNPAWRFYNHANVRKIYDGSLNYLDAIVSSPTPKAGTGCLYLTRSGTYSSTTTYYIGDTVVYNSNTYKCIVNTGINNVLPTNTNNWTLVQTGIASTYHSWAIIDRIKFWGTGSAITVCFWLYTGIGQQNAHIFNFSNTLTNNKTQSFFMMWNGSTFSFCLNQGGNFTFLDSTINFSKRVWEHYHVVIYPGTKYIRFGKNGTSGLSSTFTTSTANIQTFKTWSVCVLGKKTDATITDGNDPQFTCYIDDFRVYNKELDQGELTAIYRMTVV